MRSCAGKDRHATFAIEDCGVVSREKKGVILHSLSACKGDVKGDGLCDSCDVQRLYLNYDDDGPCTDKMERHDDSGGDGRQIFGACWECLA